MASHIFGSDIDLKLNQGIRLVAHIHDDPLTLDPVRPGHLAYFTGSSAMPSGIIPNGHLGVVDAATGLGTDRIRLFAGVNRTENIVSVWTYARGGVSSVPPAPGNPQGLGTYSPFLVGGQSVIPATHVVEPDRDGTGDHDPIHGGLYKRYLGNFIPHAHADLLDGYHASLLASSYAIAVRAPGGHLRVPLEPTEDDHAICRRYADNIRASIRVRTAVQLRTVAALDDYDYTPATQTLTAKVNGTLVIDGFTPGVNERVMIADQVDPSTNWIMKVVNTGAPGAKWVLQRYFTPTNPDPDNLGDYDYGDYFAVTAGTLNAGTTWVMSGAASPVLRSVPPGAPVYFNLFQMSQALGAGHGIVISGGKVHFYDNNYASVLNRFPYFLANVDGTASIGAMALYWQTPGTFVLKGTKWRLPRVVDNVVSTQAVFEDSVLESDANAFFPVSTHGLGTSAKPWVSFFATQPDAGGVLTHVSGQFGGTSQLVRRPWATFVTDVTSGVVSFPGFGTPPANTVDVLAPSAGGPATTALRSDAKLQINQGMIPTWTGLHTFNAGILFGSATTTLAPIKFHPTVNALLTTPVSGALETDLHSTNVPKGRLYFTDATPLRRGLAFTDDINFTNDPMVQAGAGIFLGNGTQNAVRMDDISWVPVTGASTWWYRFKYDKSVPNDGSNRHFMSMNRAAGTGSGMYFYQHADGRLNIYLFDATLTYITSTAAAYMDRYDKQVIDFVAVRAETTGLWTIYINGVAATTTTGGTMNPALPITPISPIFLVGSMAVSLQTSYHRCAVFNRALTQAEIVTLSKYGIDIGDQWGQVVPLYSSNFATDDGWTVFQASILSNQSIGGKNPVLRMAGGNIASGSLISKGVGLARQKRVRFSGDYYIPTANTVAKRLYVSCFNTAPPMSVYLSQPAGDTWVSFLHEPTVLDSLAVGSNNAISVYMTNATPSSNVAFPVTDYVYLHNLVVSQIGAIVDLNLGVGVGTTIPDRSGRYPGTLSGSNYYHLLPKPVGSGDGVYSEVRKVIKSITAIDNQSVNVIHDLGTTAVTVETWNSLGQKGDVAIIRRVGFESSQVTLNFGLIGAPSVPQAYMVVITG